MQMGEPVLLAAGYLGACGRWRSQLLPLQLPLLCGHGGDGGGDLHVMALVRLFGAVGHEGAVRGDGDEVALPAF